MTSTTPPAFTQFTQPLTQTVPQSHVSMTATVAHSGVSTQPTFVGLGTPQPYVPPPVDAKIVSLSGATSSVDLLQHRNETLQTPGVNVSQPVVATSPTVIIKQPEPVRPHNGSTSFKAYREYGTLGWASWIKWAGYVCCSCSVNGRRSTNCYLK